MLQAVTPKQLDLLLTSEAARILSVSSETLRLWTRHGRLPVMLTANGVRVFNRADVTALAERLALERAPRSVSEASGR